MTDAEKVLQWMGYERTLGGWSRARYPGKEHYGYERAPFPPDREFIYGEIIPALAPNMKSVEWFPALNKVNLWVFRKLFEGTGPTFEAAFLAASAAAIRSMGDE